MNKKIYVMLIIVCFLICGCFGGLKTDVTVYADSNTGFQSQSWFYFPDTNYLQYLSINTFHLDIIICSSLIYFIKIDYKIKTKLLRNCEHDISIEASSLALEFIKKNLYK